MDCLWLLSHRKVVSFFIESVSDRMSVKANSLERDHVVLAWTEQLDLWDLLELSLELSARSDDVSDFVDILISTKLVDCGPCSGNDGS